jgi:hypothetical protein
MAAVFCWFAMILLVVCAMLQFTSLRAIGCWLMTLFPAALCIGVLLDLARGGGKGSGAASYNSDLRTLAFLLVLFAVTALAALRPRWIWPFWIVWIFNAVFCGIAVYLTFFWKVFS